MVIKDFKEENEYLAKLKNLVISLLKDEPMKIVIFGSRARRDNHNTSDVDLGLIPYGNIDRKKLALIRQKIEDLNIPYKVEIVDFSQTAEVFKKEALKEVIVWKD